MFEHSAQNLKATCSSGFALVVDSDCESFWLEDIAATQRDAQTQIATEPRTEILNMFAVGRCGRERVACSFESEGGDLKAVVRTCQGISDMTALRHVILIQLVECDGNTTHLQRIPTEK